MSAVANLMSWEKPMADYFRMDLQELLNAAVNSVCNILCFFSNLYIITAIYLLLLYILIVFNWCNYVSPEYYSSQS